MIMKRVKQIAFWSPIFFSVLCALTIALFFYVDHATQCQAKFAGGGLYKDLRVFVVDSAFLVFRATALILFMQFIAKKKGDWIYIMALPALVFIGYFTTYPFAGLHQFMRACQFP